MLFLFINVKCDPMFEDLTVIHHTGTAMNRSGHINFEEETITNPSEAIATYLNRVRHVLRKSRPSPYAQRASASAYLKTVIQALQDYTLTIWTTGRNTALTNSKTYSLTPRSNISTCP